jgi:hypothetical protein
VQAGRDSSDIHEPHEFDFDENVEVFTLTEESNFAYAVGYSAKKILEKHSCDKCRTGLFESGISLFDSVFDFMRMPAISLIEYCKKLEYIIQTEMTHCWNEGIVRRAWERASQLLIPISCDLFPRECFVQYFFRMRIFYITKFENQKMERSALCGKNKSS